MAHPELHKVLLELSMLELSNAEERAGAVDAAASTPGSVHAASPAAADVTGVTADEPRRQKKSGCVNPVVALLRCCPLPVRNVAIHCAFYPTLGLLRLRACCCGSSWARRSG